LVYRALANDSSGGDFDGGNDPAIGGKRWQALHRLIYMCAILGVIHYYWLVKSDVRKPLIYAFWVAILLLWRAWDTYFRGKRSVPVAARPRVPAAD